MQKKMFFLLLLCANLPVLAAENNLNEDEKLIALERQKAQIEFAQIMFGDDYIQEDTQEVFGGGQESDEMGDASFAAGD